MTGIRETLSLLDELWHVTLGPGSRIGPCEIAALLGQALS
jgi:hypothetical protein